MFRFRFLSALGSLFAVLASTSFCLALGVPPAPENPVVHRIAPAECLAYLSWSATADADPTSANSVEKLMAEPAMQEAIDAIDALVREYTPTTGAGDLFGRLSRNAARQTAALYLAEVQLGDGPPQVQAGAIFDLGENAAALAGELERWQTETFAAAAQPQPIDGQPFFTVRLDPSAPPITWGVRDSFLLITVGDGEMERLLARMQQEPPAWLTAIADTCPIERRSVIAFLNHSKVIETISQLPEGEMAKPFLDQLGLSSVRSIAIASGLDAEGFVTRACIDAPGEPTGLLKVFSGAALTDADLAVVPADAPAALAFKLDTVELFDLVTTMMGNVGGPAADQVPAMREGFQEAFQADIRDDVLASLGDTWTLFAAPDDGGLLTGWTIAVALKDRETFNKFFTSAMNIAKTVLPRDSIALKQTQVGKQQVYSAKFLGDLAIYPAWCVADDHLVFSLYPQAVLGFLGRKADFQPLKADAFTAGQSDQGDLQSYGQLDGAAAVQWAYPFALTAMRYLSQEHLNHGSDIESILPPGSAWLPHLKGNVTTWRRVDGGLQIVSRQAAPGVVGTAMSLELVCSVPQVMEQIDLWRQSQGVNCLQQIAIACLDYHDNNKSFPPAASVDADGKPLLSWRVLILPYMGEQELYQKFHLDEPWDSEHNKTLLTQMPDVYRMPASKSPAGTTVVLGNGGEEKGVFALKIPVQIGDITDGSSATILAVEAADEQAVPWTKPQDYDYEKTPGLKALVGSRKTEPLVVCCDGTVCRVPNSIEERKLPFYFDYQDDNVVWGMREVEPYRLPWESRRLRGPGAVQVREEFPRDREVTVPEVPFTPKDSEPFDDPFGPKPDGR
ncbi:DUF1559 family PulG-like putative transporter [Lignipirellula cremea]|uniref:DUF1559 domain-containing protein n=1 Tax=Lignipirellula cremea TaxID=2528010 RepID=A0A518DPX5_9BACT|nr:DUF1559 domain-containing protein [Lignipirellula cremea]QDU93889.1 hypothetical protein Pla8534_16740 [Lignipirellula cremea]